MKTAYKLGQRVYYVECHSYALSSNQSVGYYRPFKGVVDVIAVHQWKPWNRRLKRDGISVRYGVRLDCKKDKGYPQQNSYIFAKEKNAREYARLLNKMVKSYKTDNANKDQARQILKEMNEVRKYEPVEPNVY